MVPPNDMFDVIAEIHQAGLEPKRWSSVVVRIAELMGASCGSFHFLDRSTGDLDVFGSHGFDPAACRGYQEHYYRIDRLTEAVLRFPPGLCFVGQQLVDLENFEGSEFYRDFLSPLGMCHFVGGRTLEAEGVAAMVGFHRSSDRGPFDPRDATKLGLRTLFGIVPGVCYLVGTLCFLRFRLDEAAHLAIRRELDARA